MGPHLLLTNDDKGVKVPRTLVVAMNGQGGVRVGISVQKNRNPGHSMADSHKYGKRSKRLMRERRSTKRIIHHNLLNKNCSCSKIWPVGIQHSTHPSIHTKMRFIRRGKGVLKYGSILCSITTNVLKCPTQRNALMFQEVHLKNFASFIH